MAPEGSSTGVSKKPASVLATPANAMMEIVSRSTSVSFNSGEPRLAAGPSSETEPVSSTATGASFTAMTLRLTVA
ncbi:hypothetical protein R2601_04608 [Salipiger bermudensis HTCC2601]|uniref:Uncharacterized protein n=1 Tax=Salipiger bermudensis (strain DSM 26914 / JCM 13377 / KCTC 12554 / HTCC2601) TaxID=314265 RepID=Q0FVS4_SALBH|nr:hypothetical protein R2601_04608 [Salipiger bermudensis HTCC2601]